MTLTERDQQRIERLLVVLREELERQPDLISHRLSILWNPERNEVTWKPERKRKV